jgi:hypothetical protein
MTDHNLSPQAQAVLDAVCNNTEPDCDTQHLIAAALRAAVKLTRKQKVMKTLGVTMAKSQPYCHESELLAIAAELENSNV